MAKKRKLTAFEREFSAARGRKADTFSFGGKSYTTKLAGGGGKTVTKTKGRVKLPSGGKAPVPSAAPRSSGAPAKAPREIVHSTPKERSQRTARARTANDKSDLRANLPSMMGAPDSKPTRARFTVKRSEPLESQGRTAAAYTTNLSGPRGRARLPSFMGSPESKPDRSAAKQADQRRQYERMKPVPMPVLKHGDTGAKPMPVKPPSTRKEKPVPMPSLGISRADAKPKGSKLQDASVRVTAKSGGRLKSRKQMAKDVDPKRFGY